LSQWFIQLSPVQQAFVATCFTWLVTAVGASFVFFFKSIDQRLLDGMLGFAAGVMLAASYWSLLAPSIEVAASIGGGPAWAPAVIGFLLGGATIRLFDLVLPHLHLGLPPSEAEGVRTGWRRSILLVLAITLHNFPEGLAVGVAFGAAAAGYPAATLAGALTLAIGIGLQNLPEGTSVAVPLRREGMTRLRSFWYGQLSAVIEPVGGVLGATLVLVMLPILPYALAFAAGAMVFVVAEELIPESQTGKHADIATLGLMLGFALMMMLDVALG